MASSSINDTFVLANYTSSLRGKTSKKYTPGVYASCTKKSQSGSSSDAYVTLAVQADGVHVLDTSNLHPVTSQTLGPSTSFSCPPITLPSSSNRPLRTYAVISASPDLSSADEGGRTLWAWRDDTSTTKQKAKQTKVILSTDHTAFGLYSCEETPERIIVLSTAGELSVVDAETLDVKSTFSTGSSSVIHATVLPASTSYFSSGRTGAVAVIASSGSSKMTHLRILAIDEADSISQQQEHDIPVKSEDVVSISCSQTGIISVLSIDGVWSSYRLPTDASSSPANLSPPLRLSNLAFIASRSKYPASTLALTSSHVLLAAVASHEIVILLWDLQFSVLLASHTLPVPSALTSSTLHIRLVPGSQSTTKTETQVIGQAILILSSLPSKETSDNKTSSVLVVVPFSVPTLSTIAAAMGRGDVGKKWLGGSEQQTQKSELEKSRAKLLDTMRSGMQGGRPQAAVAAFMKWASENDDKDPGSSLEYNFVKELLSIVLVMPSEQAKTTGAYATDVIRYLLEKRVVCSGMIPSAGGLLGALRSRDDWASIDLAFDSVLDLTEAEIIETLQTVVRTHRASGTTASGAATEDAMEVDAPAPTKASSASVVTSLPTFLTYLANYPTSRGPLLLAVRRNLREAEDLTAVLGVLESWIVKKTKMDERLMPTKKDLKKNEQGVWIVAGRKTDKIKKKDEVPSLERSIDLLQIILDASFLTLLQYPPSHKVLRRVQELLNPEISFAGTIESLRGHLEPFALAQEKTIKESLVPPQEREREKQKGDWRQKRKDLAVDIGLYKLEELVL